MVLATFFLNRSSVNNLYCNLHLLCTHYACSSPTFFCSRRSGTSGPRVAMMSQELGGCLRGPPRGQHLRACSCEDASGEVGRITSRAASLGPNVRGWLKRNRPDHHARGITQPRVSRKSQTKRPRPPRIPANPETRVVRMSQARRPGPPIRCADVSALPSLGQN